jgi:SOS-response transcriptional repressor LexA
MDTEELCSQFAKRLNLALDLRKYPPLGKGRIGYLQEIFGLSRAGANKWLHGQVFPHKKKRKLIAQTLGINLHWLETGVGEPTDLTPTQFEADQLIKNVPLLNMNEAFRLVETLNQGHYETLPMASDVSSSLFAVNYVGNAMLPKFQDGNILIVDPSIPIQDGDFILAKTSQIPEAIARQYVIGSGQNYLIATNPKFDPIVISDQVELIGKIIEVRSKL